MHLSVIDVVVIVVYAVGIFGLAQYVAREREGHTKNGRDYFLASNNLPWWAIGTSLIAANISAEQIVGMSGSGYAIGLAIASYEWMAALTLLIVGKYFLPIFLKHSIYTMPQFLEHRFGAGIRNLMAVFWLALYVFVNLTSILWLGSIAVHKVAGVDQDIALYALAGFALLYQLYGGLKAVALTDVVQVTLLIAGGLIVSGLTLAQIGGTEGILGGFAILVERAPDHFHMILTPDNPHYKDLPGLSVLIGGMWIANLSYWGFNQYIIQRALAAKNLGEAQKGILLASLLKLLMPLVIVVPGIAAVVLAPNLTRPDEAYPAMMGLLPPGLLGLVFAALMAAIVASSASKINSIATIFSLDLYAKALRTPSDQEDLEIASEAREKHLVTAGRISAIVAVAIAAATARPLLGNSDQAFQFIQEFTGFFTPGITVIFLAGLFWRRATEAGAIAAAIASVSLSYWCKIAAPGIPFLDRMGIVFLASLVLMVLVSLTIKPRAEEISITSGVSFATPVSFNVMSVGIIATLIALYATWW